ncbi:MAG: DUF892 family protein [Armatimonadota bacterium]
MAMDLREYIRLRCSAMLQTERDLSRLNDRFIEDVSNKRISEMLRWHTRHFQEQVACLDEVVNHLGGFAWSGDSAVAYGFKEEYQRVQGAQPSEYLTDMQILHTTAAISALKIMLYRGLLDLAELLGDRDVIQRLSLSKADEERMRSRIEDERPAIETELAGELRRAA